MTTAAIAIVRGRGMLRRSSLFALSHAGFGASGTGLPTLWASGVIPEHWPSLCWPYRLRRGETQKESGLGVGSSVDGRPDLLTEAEVVTVIPDLGDLAVLEAIDVHRRERRRSTGWFDRAP
jgi:hypothetical protein